MKRSTFITWDQLKVGLMILVALGLIVVAVILAVEMKGLLIGEAASVEDQEKIVAAIEIEPSVQRLIHMRTQHIGPDELIVGAKIELVADLSVAEAADAVNRIETSVRRAVPSARIMYLEPDVFRTHVPSEGDEPAHLGGSSRGDATGPGNGTGAVAAEPGSAATPAPEPAGGSAPEPS